MIKSFYGDYDGKPFMIKKVFSSVAEMVKAFEGGQSTEIDFGDYVILNYVNRNHPLNGGLYRRGLDYNSERKILDYNYDFKDKKWVEKEILANGAEFVGILAGPIGESPKIEVVNYEDVGKTPENMVDYNSFTANIELVPGSSYSKGTIREATYFNEETHESVSKIGIQVPYTVFDVKVTGLEAGEKPEVNISKKNNDNNFHKVISFKIPEGIKGDTFQNLRIEEVDGKSVLKYDAIDYTNKKEGELTSVKLGNYNIIKDVIFDDKGTIKIKYTYDEPDTYSQLLTWVKSISIKQDGTVSVESNNDRQLLSSEQEKLKWPVNISLDKNTGKVITTYNDGSAETSQDPQMDWITSANLDDNKMLSINYVNAENIEVNLKTPNEVTLDDANGDIYVKYNTGENIAIGNIGENMNIMSACAASEEDGAPETLKAGGIWFVTQDA